MAAILGVLAAYYLISASRISVIIDGQLYPTLGDDQYISMRYARHLADGHGLVWNIGETPVEGYTNFLWVVWIAGLTLFARDPSYLMLASTAAFHIASVLLFYRFLRATVHASLFAATCAAFLLMSWSPIRTQAVGATEVPMLLFVLVAAVYWLFGTPVDRGRTLVGAFLAGLLTLVRPDGWLLAVALLVGFAWQTVSSRSTSNRHPQWKWVLPLFLGPGALLTLFRLLYFGDWLPNTYYLKVVNRPGRVEYGLAYVGRFLRDFYATWLILPLSVYSLLQNKRWLSIAGLVPIGVLVCVAYQGGDAWDGWRFMVPILPFLLLVLACLTEHSRSIRPVYGAALSAWATLVFLALVPVASSVAKDSFFPSVSLETADNIRLGLILGRVCEPAVLTADFWAGATPYYSELPSVDMLGRSDWHIARSRAYKAGAAPGHDKFDFGYVMSRRPDVVVSNHALRLSADETAAIKASDYPFGALLLENEEFKDGYAPIVSLISSRWHGIFSRRDSDGCDWSCLPAEELRVVGASCMVVPDGWYALERDDSSDWRWTSGRGTVLVAARATSTLEVQGEITSIQVPNSVEVLANGERLTTLRITKRDWCPFEFSLGIGPDAATIEFVSQNPATAIATDSRPLAVAVQDLSLTLGDGGETCDAGWR